MGIKNYLEAANCIVLLTLSGFLIYDSISMRERRKQLEATMQIERENSAYVEEHNRWKEKRTERMERHNASMDSSDAIIDSLEGKLLIKRAEVDSMYNQYLKRRR